MIAVAPPSLETNSSRRAAQTGGYPQLPIKIILVLRLRGRLRLLNGFRVVQGVSDRGLRGPHSRTDPGLVASI